MVLLALLPFASAVSSAKLTLVFSVGGGCVGIDQQGYVKLTVKHSHFVNCSDKFNGSGWANGGAVSVRSLNGIAFGIISLRQVLINRRNGLHRECRVH
jgi:hypothetical protein